MTEPTLLTNHGLALVCIAGDPGVRVRDIASCVGVTERAAHRIVSELCAAGYLSKSRDGRRNTYELHRDAPLRHDLLGGRALGDLLDGLAARGEDGGRAAA